MLKSRFSKSTAGFKAQKLFTDRVEPRAVFAQSVEAWPERPQEIVVYYGKGGIGKSSLLKNLAAEAQTVYDRLPDRQIRSIMVSLEAYDFANPVNILMAIRNGVSGDCGLFDYAMLQYCAKAKLNVEENMQKNSMLSSPVMGVLNEIIALGTMSACIPTATIQKCVELIKDRRFRARYKDEIEELAGLNEFEIFERLPYYLGLCIGFAAERGQYHVLFLDSYESLLARTEQGAFSADREDWLKELFLSAGAIRIVIASRDRLRWPQEDPEWDDYMQQHLLENLSEQDSRWFLEQVPIRDQAVIDAIVKNAGGVPLYLDMCVSIYEDDMNGGREFELTSAQNGEKIISRYIRHLTGKDKQAIKILAAPRWFDLRFADELLRRRQVLYEAEELSALLEKSIFLPVDEARGLWKVDESVRLHQRARIGREQAAVLLGSILDCLIQTPEGRYYPHLSLVIETVCAWPDILETIGERCIQAVEYYANMGFWAELHTMLAGYTDSPDRRLRALAVVEELIYLRRVGRLRDAQALGESHPLDKDDLGVWYYMYRYIRIQIKHLLGFYDESLAAYDRLREEMSLIRPLIPDHIYLAPCMKYADLLFLKGRFDESLALVESLLAEKGLSAGDKIELLRIKGHIYRFRQGYEQAAIIYQAALQLAEEQDLRASRGKLYTNMAEALCVTDPGQALVWYERAREENYAAGNDIELGKAYAAASAARTASGEPEEGIMLARQAIATAEKTGYRSGQAFGLTVPFYALKTAGRDGEADGARQALASLIGEIGVYEYLLRRVEA